MGATMTYTKPELTILGRASKAIGFLLPKSGLWFDFTLIRRTAPAYDPDE